MNEDLNDHVPVNGLDDQLSTSGARQSDDVQIQEMSAALKLTQEVEGILDDLTQNRFRECVAVVLGEDMEIKENFQVKESSMVFGQEVDGLSSCSKEVNVSDEKFVYDTSSDEELTEDTSTSVTSSEAMKLAPQIPQKNQSLIPQINNCMTSQSPQTNESIIPQIPQRNQCTLMDQQVGRLAPWKEIFPALYVPHMSPPRPLYWTSTALKTVVLATKDLKEISINCKSSNLGTTCL